VFAIEELSKEHVRNFRDVLLLSVIIAGLTSQLLSGSYLYLGTPVVPKDNGLWALSLVMLCSLLSGMLGGLFSKILLALMRWREKKKMAIQIAVVAATGLFFAFIYHSLGPRNLYSGKDSIHAVLFGTEMVPWSECLTRFFMPIVTSMTGVAGGIFAPALSAGAVFGATVASFIDPQLIVVLGLSGMVGFLTGVTHTPITSFVLVLEMTDRHSVVLPMMIAALSSSIGAHIISKDSYYEEVVEEMRAKTEKDKADTIS
jgi:H+/Cl- antiporter ClcA